MEDTRRFKKSYWSCLNWGSHALLIWHWSFMQDYEPQNTPELTCD